MHFFYITCFFIIGLLHGALIGYLIVKCHRLGKILKHINADKLKGAVDFVEQNRYDLMEYTEFQVYKEGFEGRIKVIEAILEERKGK